MWSLTYAKANWSLGLKASNSLNIRQEKRLLLNSCFLKIIALSGTSERHHIGHVFDILEHNKKRKFKENKFDKKIYNCKCGGILLVINKWELIKALLWNFMYTHQKYKFFFFFFEEHKKYEFVWAFDLLLWIE